METHTLKRYLLYQIYHARIMFQAFTRHGGPDELHQFRVALRQTRSLVKLFLDGTAPFPEPIKNALKATNPIRELDVFILKLSSGDYPKLAKQFMHLRKTMFQSLTSGPFVEETLFWLDQYYTLISGLEMELQTETLIQKALSRYEECMETYRTLPSDAAAKTLHRLRIGFKDARYGFEFLDWFAIRKEEAIMRRCKRMQNRLGAVQDAFNQLEWLEKLYREYPSDPLTQLIQKQTKALKKLKGTTLSERSPAL